MTLQKLGFVECFTHWIKTLYNNPLASIRTNGIISSPFQLQRGTRQGCPLSPLLFALFIEPLAAAIRQNDKISGVIFIQNPKTSLSEIMKLINEYSIISDYSINWTKSTILPLNMKPHDQSIQNIPFKISNITLHRNKHITEPL